MLERCQTCSFIKYRCLQATVTTLNELKAQGAIKPVEIEGLARLLNGMALNAALWVASSEVPEVTLQKAVAAFECLASGIVTDQQMTQAPPFRA